MTEAQLADSPSHAMTLRPWGRVEGTLRIGAKPGAGERVVLSLPPISPEADPRTYYDYKAETDAQGRFVFERVVPRRASVSRAIEPTPNLFTLGPWVPVEVKPGETAQVSVGGTGRPVIGRAVKPAGRRSSRSTGRFGELVFRLKPPTMNQPPNMNPKQQKAPGTRRGSPRRRERRTWLTCKTRDSTPSGSSATARSESTTSPPAPTSWPSGRPTARGGEPSRPATRTVVVTGTPGVRNDEPLEPRRDRADREPVTRCCARYHSSPAIRRARQGHGRVVSSIIGQSSKRNRGPRTDGAAPEDRHNAFALSRHEPVHRSRMRSGRAFT